MPVTKVRISLYRYEWKSRLPSNIIWIPNQSRRIDRTERNSFTRTSHICPPTLNKVTRTELFFITPLPISNCMKIRTTVSNTEGTSRRSRTANY